MAIVITSPGLVTTGTEGADRIDFQTGAVAFTGNGSTLNGLGGSDTIQSYSGFVTVSAANKGAGAVINAGGGADKITLSVSGGTTSADNVIVNGGAGRDTITFIANASGAMVSNVAGGDGGDKITLLTATFSGVGGGAGLDTIEVSGASLTTGSKINLGAGNDVISGAAADDLVLYTAAGINGGGGSDTITLHTVRGVTGAFINGDSSSDGGAADKIVVNTQGAGTTIRGKGGADTIDIEDVAGSAVVAGNAGRDVINALDLGAGASIQGGQGGDSIIFSGATTTTANSIIAGGGNDTIQLSASTTTGLLVDLGAGVDKVEYSAAAIADDDDLGTLQVGSFSDSKLGAVDTYYLSGAAASAVIGLNVAAGSALGLGSAQGFSGAGNIETSEAAGTGFLTGVGQAGSATNGHMTFSGEASASLATAVQYADAATLIQGTDSGNQALGKAITFTNGGDEYLFIQGGAAGTSDDYIIRFSGSTNATVDATINLQMVITAAN